jgi:predicted AlkP superfamily pyrophosphatase or phosphodiesterase
MRLAHRLAAAGLALLAATAANAAAFAAAPPKPKLVVAISMDQFALALFQKYRPTYTGGLKRLGEGLAFTGYQSHAATETCPGHSTILTGEHPSHTGIVANNWYDRATGSNVYCVSKRGVADPSAKTSEFLKVDTLGDWMRKANPRSRSYAVSGKDRAAIMMGGHHATAIYWWDDGVGFTTSKYAGPADAKTLAPAKAFDRALFAAWRAKPPELWPAQIPDRCKALEKPYTYGKMDLTGAIPPQSAKDVTPAKPPFDDSGFTAELRASPIFDPLALTFAETLVARHKLGQGPAPDLLAVSLSSTDHIGHRFGSGGAEMCVHMAAVDAALGEFFDRLDRLKTPYVVVLTADHGGVDAAERLGPPARRIDVVTLQAQLSGYLKKTFGLAYDPLAGDDPHQLIFDLAPLDDARRADIVKAAAAWLKARPEVTDVLTPDEVAAATPPKGKPVETLTLAERFNESFDRARAGDLIVNYPEFASLGVPLSAGSNVAGHGSPWDHDRQVPILFWWKGVTPTAETRSMETVDIAPTLAAVVGIKAPPVDGRCVDIGQTCPR